MIEEDATSAVLDRRSTSHRKGRRQAAARMRVKNGPVRVRDRNFDEDLPIGYIRSDSVHSPVRKVNYAVEAARLGQMTITKSFRSKSDQTARSSAGCHRFASKLIKDHMSIFINSRGATRVVEK